MLPFTLFIVVLDPIVQRRANLHMNKKRNFRSFKWYRVVQMVFFNPEKVCFEGKGRREALM